MNTSSTPQFYSRIAVICAALLLTSTFAQAQTEKPALSADEAGFTATFGVGVGRMSIRGATDKVKAFPVVSIDYQNGKFFAGMLRGIGYDWVKSEALTLSTAITGVIGRREKDGARFKGLGDVKGSAALNLSTDWTPSGAPFAFQAGVTKPTDSKLGSAFNFGVGTVCPLNDKLFFSTNLSVNYADKKRMQTLYGVTPLQALDSGYAARVAKAGVESIDVGMGLRYAVDKQWSLSANVGANRLQSDAAASPVYKAKTTATGALLASYRF